MNDKILNGISYHRDFTDNYIKDEGGEMIPSNVCICMAWNAIECACGAWYIDEDDTI